MSNEAPLVWTSKGNVPADSLDYEEQWVLDGEVFALLRRYRDKATGELVSNSFHGFGMPKEARDALRPYLTPPSSDVTVGLQGAGIGGQQAAMA
jgi:hypothetical protein